MIDNIDVINTESLQGSAGQIAKPFSKAELPATKKQSSNPLAPKKPQGIEVRNPSVMVKGEEPLMAEARKYKTAEEFINSKEKVYHGTNAKFDKFDLSKIGSQTDEGVRGRGIYFTPNKEMAKSTIRGGNAKYIKEVIINKDKLFDISKYKDVSKMADDLDMREGNFTKGPDGIIRPVLSQNGQFTSHVEDLGYEGVYVNRGGKGDELVIFNPENIKTKSQLKQIREEANKTKGLQPKK